MRKLVTTERRRDGDHCRGLSGCLVRRSIFTDANIVRAIDKYPLVSDSVHERSKP